jgi:hypothetical protein
MKKTWFLMLLPILAALVMVLSSSCTNESGARSALRSHGFKNVQITGYAGPFECGEDDLSTTGFTATNQAGQKVSGVVCCGWFKSCTVRF